MDKELLKFLNGEINTLNGVTIGREKNANGYCYMTISYDNTVINSFWYDPQKPKKSDKPPKHTGGKPAYLKVYYNELKKKELSLESLGLLTRLGLNIQWNTGKLINARTKNALTMDELCKIAGKTHKTITKTLKELQEKGVLTKDKKEYLLSPDFIAKGGGSREKKDK
jgi:hypothetical protein